MRNACQQVGAQLYYETHAGESYSSPTLDITGSIGLPEYRFGIPFAVEVKRFDGKGKLTGRQEHTIREMRRGRIAVFTVYSEETLSDFIQWITSRCCNPLSIEGT